MADSGHPPAELHERLLICRTIKLNAGAHGGHRRCCHAQMQKNAQNKPQIARLILCVHTTLQVYCNLFLTFCVQNSQKPILPRNVQRRMHDFVQSARSIWDVRWVGRAKRRSPPRGPYFKEEMPSLWMAFEAVKNDKTQSCNRAAGRKDFFDTRKCHPYGWHFIWRSSTMDRIPNS